MRKLPPPQDEHGKPLDPDQVFATCISRVRDKPLKSRLKESRTSVAEKCEDYHKKALSKSLHKVKPQATVGKLTSEEMVAVYTSRMAKAKSPGRGVYDRISETPRYRLCPLCGVGTANTLDHFLPKSKFPALSVNPNNLVPACSWCQWYKDDYAPTQRGEQLLHPYYDDYNNEAWLFAEVMEVTPVVFRYFAAPPAHWAYWEKQRVSKHLTQLQLDQLFSNNAGSRLSEIRARLMSLFKAGGPTAVREHLRGELESSEACHINSWPSAMFRAASISAWFCAGGFSET